MSPEPITRRKVAAWIPRRPRQSRKNDFGHVLVVAGSRGMSGAPVLSALGALRGGAGLVTVATARSREPLLAKRLIPEAMTLPLPETSAGTIAPAAVPVILEFIRRRRITALAVGPGLSRHSATGRFLQTLLSRLAKNREPLLGIVLDADGFVLMGKEPDALSRLSLPLIVTPHIGELSLFCGVKKEKIALRPGAFGEKFAKLNRTVLVLKGHRTLVTDGRKSFRNTTGNPGMATGGSGDVLSGLIAALLPQIGSGPLLLKAAAAAVFIHGLAGDLAARGKTEIGMSATDIAAHLPAALRKIFGRKGR